MTKRIFRNTNLSLLFLLFMGWGPLSYGQHPTPSPRDMSDAELDQRLAFIETRLAGLNPNARYWQHGWTGWFTATTVGQAVIAIAGDDNDNRINFSVGAFKSAAGLAQMLVKPLPAVTSSERFQAIPSQTRAQRMRKLEQGEALLRENADRTQQRYTWKRHLPGVGVNLLGGAVIAAYGDGTDAVISTLVGIAVIEANIWTEPTRALTDLEDYQNKFRNVRRTSARNWRLVPMKSGAALHISF